MCANMLLAVKVAREEEKDPLSFDLQVVRVRSKFLLRFQYIFVYVIVHIIDVIL